MIWWERLLQRAGKNFEVLTHKPMEELNNEHSQMLARRSNRNRVFLLSMGLRSRESEVMKLYTGQEIHGFMFPDYKPDEPRWVDARELGPVLRLIDDNADLMREPAASLKSIKTIVRQVGVGVMNCPACGVAYVLGARHFSECKLNPGATALSGGTVE